ncbi:MAG: polysaccharide pyruvyl transferase family protein [Lentisphaeria bacterium]|nr:polysaccharide pyruvyl transferase family protein [Lentisphaeria bacterium]
MTMSPEGSRFRFILLRDFRTVKDGRVICYNIGTAAHGFGTLSVLQKYLPEAKCAVWADAPLSDELAAMMRRRFPDVPVVAGTLKDGAPSTPELAAAVDRTDLFLVGSGSGIAPSVATSLAEFRRLTGKAAAAYAIGCSRSFFPLLKELDSASFRDSEALELAGESGNVRIGPAPDAVFDFDCADDVFAEEFLRKNSLRTGEFVCCIPGWRVTPRWEFFGGPASPEKVRRNEAFVAHDLALLREAVIHTVRRHGKKVLLCAEQIPEMSLLGPLFRSLPADAASACVVLPVFWDPAEALGVYRRSAAVFGIEMHSQVMALGSGIPSAVFRHSGFGSKSSMWKDIGVPEWLLEIDDPDSAAKACAIVDSLLDGPSAREKVRRCRERIDRAAGSAVRRQFRVAG